jgi:hypothetical protein
MFQEKFKGLTAKGLLIVELKLAAIRSGYSLAVLHSSSARSPTSEREFSCALKCVHGTIYRKNIHQQNASIKRAPYKTSTKRPTETNLLCPFKIKIFLQKDSATKFPGRWFLVGESSNDCCHHRNHFKLDSAHIHASTQLMTEEEKRLAKEDYKLALRIQYWTREGKPCIRGKVVPPIPHQEDYEDDCHAGGDSDSDSNDDMDITTSRSHVAQSILGPRHQTSLLVSKISQLMFIS